MRLHVLDLEFTFLDLLRFPGAEGPDDQPDDEEGAGGEDGVNRGSDVVDHLGAFIGEQLGRQRLVAHQLQDGRRLDCVVQLPACGQQDLARETVRIDDEVAYVWRRTKETLTHLSERKPVLDDWYQKTGKLKLFISYASVDTDTPRLAGTIDAKGPDLPLLIQLGAWFQGGISWRIK